MADPDDIPAPAPDQAVYAVALMLPDAPGWRLLPGPSDPIALARVLRRHGPCLDRFGGTGILVQIVDGEEGTVVEAISDHNGRMRKIKGPDHVPPRLTEHEAALWSEAADGYARGLAASAKALRLAAIEAAHVPSAPAEAPASHDDAPSFPQEIEVAALATPALPTLAHAANVRPPSAFGPGAWAMAIIACMAALGILFVMSASRPRPLPPAAATTASYPGVAPGGSQAP